MLSLCLCDVIYNFFSSLLVLQFPTMPAGRLAIHLPEGVSVSVHGALKQTGVPFSV